MQITNAIKKLNKAGFSVMNNKNRYSAQAGRSVIRFIEQDSKIICINVHSVNDKDDIYTDYCAGVFCDNLSQAIMLAR